MGLATSAQFMWTSHWIVMDSLLMLFTTAALWAAHELVRGGEEVKLSKRKGDIILLREDVIDEVGPDATRFTYLIQSIDTKLVFDLAN